MADYEDSLPIFPLSLPVLFPRVKTPLHLFEPRYRQLGRDVLAGDRRLAMVVVRPEHAQAMTGDPPIFPVGCAGVVTESQQLPDGRYNIVLLGEQRVRVVEEAPPQGERLYRLARVERLADAYPEAERARVGALRQAIVEDVGELMRRAQTGRSRRRFEPDLFANLDDESFVNAISNAFALDPLEKQSLLEADSIPERYSRLASALSFRRSELEALGNGNRGHLH